MCFLNNVHHTVVQIKYYSFHISDIIVGNIVGKVEDSELPGDVW